MSFRHLRGSGIEIGALHNPVYVAPSTKVKYVDRLPIEELVALYPELRNYKVVEPDVIDDGEILSKIAPESVDFIIANHFIEHCEDPIGTLQNFLNKLCDKGIIYMAVPDKRRTFDRKRQSTPFEHLAKDYESGPALSREEHYWDYVKNVVLSENASEAEIQCKINELKGQKYSIHYHVWTGEEFLNFLKKSIERFKLPMTVLDVRAVQDENIFILQKTTHHNY